MRVQPKLLLFFLALALRKSICIALPSPFQLRISKNLRLDQNLMKERRLKDLQLKNHDSI